MVGRKVRVMAAAAALAVVLTGCNTTSSTPVPIDLSGLWRVTPGTGSSYGLGGTTTVEFGTASSGLATYLSKSTANGITTCESQVYAAISDKVVLLDGTYYAATTPTADRIVLNDGTATVTLDRVTGSPPVAGCAQGTASLVKTLPDPVSSQTTLNAVGNELYYNLDDTHDSIVGYNTATGTFGTPRAYTDTVSGGNHRFVVAARTDNLFYGQCACGGSNTLDYFNLGTDASITHVDTQTLGTEISIRFGAYTSSGAVIGGRSWSDTTKNVLLTLNPSTLALIGQRQILPEANIRDITWRGSELLALVNGSVVVVGSSGQATATYQLSGATPYVQAIAAIGSTVYAIGTTAAGDSVLYKLTLP